MKNILGILFLVFFSLSISSVQFCFAQRTTEILTIKKIDKFTKANQQLNQKNYQKATELYQEYIAENKDDERRYDALRQLGTAYVALNDLNKAYKAFFDLAFSDSTIKNTKNADEYAISFLAMVLNNRQKYEDSLKYYKKLLKKYPKGKYSIEAKKHITALIPVVEEIKTYNKERANIVEVIERWKKAIETKNMGLLKSCLAVSAQNDPSLEEAVLFWGKYDKIKIRLPEIEYFQVEFKDNTASAIFDVDMETTPSIKDGKGQKWLRFIKENGKWRIIQL